MDKDMDQSLSQGTMNMSVVSIELPVKSQADAAKTSLSFMDHYKLFIDEFRPFRSFVMYISLAQIAVFVCHVILAAIHGFTMGLLGPTFNEVGYFDTVQCQC